MIILMKPTTYIFDLDGTLLNTLEDLSSSVNHAMEQCHYPTHSTDRVREMVGNGVRRLIERAVPQGTPADDTQRALSIFQEYYLAHNEDKTQPYDGILPMLRALKQRECKIAVVSNKFDKATKALCQKYFPDLIDVAIGENESQGIRKKPHPDMVALALQQLSSSAGESVYIGDSEVDIATAQNSDLPCISVLWGFRTKDFLSSHGARILVDKPSDIINLSVKPLRS